MANYSGPPLSSTPEKDREWHRMRQNRDPTNAVSDAERQLMAENARRYLVSAEADQREILRQEASRQPRPEPVQWRYAERRYIERAASAPLSEPAPQPEPPGYRQLDLEPMREVQMPAVTVRKIEL